ncbi:MAG: phytanoyl-CoA dioxygenase family protein [bacterium]
MNSATESLSDIDLARFMRDGFIVKQAMVDPDICKNIRAVALEHLRQQLAPAEYEVDVQYPGSPESRDSSGGQTIRRLLHAYSRSSVFRDWSTCDELKQTLRRLFGAEEIRLSQCHHNCIMTKQPGYSSATLWHQDNRYWSFDEENLISVWLAVRDEIRANGCLRVIPGSHHLELEPGRFDASLFLRTDLAENKSMIAQSVQVELKQGDVLFFHSRLFHAAGRNLSEQTKLSVVFTYHQSTNQPIKDTRSARFPGISF